MRTLYILGFALYAVVCTTARTEETLPVRLLVNAENVAVFSEPNENAYATEYLGSKATIEVYRREGQEWLGIRPPKHSFSWVKTDQLETTSHDGVLRILHDDTICRVGSSVSEVTEHAGQVYLQADELVQVAPGQTPTTKTARQLEREGWCRIAPPAGEFRWVRASDLKRRGPPREVAVTTPRVDHAPTQATASEVIRVQHTEPIEPAPKPTNADPTPTIAPSKHVSTTDLLKATQRAKEEKPQATPAQAVNPTSEQEPTHSGEWTPATRPKQANDEPLVEPTDPEAVTVRSDAVDLYAPRPVPQQPKNTTPSKPLTAAPDSTLAAPVPVANAPAKDDAPPGGTPNADNWVSRGALPIDELLDIELRLARMAAQDISVWRLQPLRQRIESLKPKLKGHDQNEQAEQLLKRIAEFEGLQNRFAQSGEVAPLVGMATPRSATGAVDPPSWHDNLISQFDGSGWLVPVHSTRRAAPPYALLDAEGEVLQYVSPSPGLNLHRYLRKEVGIYGQRGTPASLNKPHVTAERVVDLGRHLR